MLRIAKITSPKEEEVLFDSTALEKAASMVTKCDQCELAHLMIFTHQDDKVPAFIVDMSAEYIDTLIPMLVAARVKLALPLPGILVIADKSKLN